MAPRLAMGVAAVLACILFVYLISVVSSQRESIARLEAKLSATKSELVHQHRPNGAGPDGQMFLSIPMRLNLDSEGFIVFPKGVTRVWFDVGAHRDAMYSLYKLREQEDLAVIAFEPLYDMWSELTVLNNHDRLFAVPAAVSETEGFTFFNRAGTDMCSSLKGIDPATKKEDWPGGCTRTAYKQPVSVVRLESFIRQVRFPYIEFLKIDAQGGDFEVLLSCGDLISRIATVVVEVQVNKPLYANAKTHDEYIEMMKSKGFELRKEMLQGRNEENLLFQNTREDAPKLTDDQYNNVLPLPKIFDGAYLKRREEKKRLAALGLGS